MKKLITFVLSTALLLSGLSAPVSAAYDKTVLLNLSFDRAEGYATALGGGGTIERLDKYDNHGGVLHFSSASGESSYIDVQPTDLASYKQYVVDLKLKPTKIDGDAYIGIIDGKEVDSAGKSVFRNGFKMYMKETGLFTKTKNYYLAAKSGGTKTKTFSINSWQRFCAVYNITEGTCDFYLNKTKVGTQTISTELNSYILRIDADGGSTTDSGLDFYIDDYRVYTGSSIRDDITEPDYTNYSIMDNNDIACSLLENDGDEYQAFSVLGNYYYIDGGRRKYASDSVHPIMVKDGDDDVYGTSTAYVPANFVSSIYGKSGSLSTYGNVITKNGINYIKASEFASAIGKKYYYDKRGMFVISDSEYPYKDSDHFIELFENADLIYRTLQFENPTGAKMLSDFQNGELANQHPRILYTKSDIDYIKEQANADANGDFALAMNNAISIGNNYLNAATRFSADCPIENKQAQAGNFQSAMVGLTTAYLLSGDTRYADVAVSCMLTLCQWQDLGWTYANLTTGHWAMGMAIGYDALYDYLTTEQKATIKQAVVSMPFADTINAYRGNGGVHWINIRDNFSGVIGGGVMALTLAFADEADLKDDIEYLLGNLIKTNEIAVSLYQTNGGYFEGVGYSDYNLQNFSISTEALFNCCGSDYDLGTAIGFSHANDFFTYMMTPNTTFNFHDCSSSASGEGLTYWFAYRYGNMKPAELQRLYRDVPSSMGLRNLLMYDKAIRKNGAVEDASIALDKYFPIAEAGSFRDSFTTKSPTFVAFHAGRTKLTHDHLDLGEFVFEANGKVWAMDLGGDNYDLPSYFGNPGYQIYRKRPEGENCIVINPSNPYDTDGKSEYYGQALYASTNICDFKSSQNSAYAVYDLTDGYKRDVDSYKRGYYLGEGRTNLTVQDEIDLKSASSEVYWFMHTRASIEVIDSHTAILTDGSQKLRAEVYCNDPNFEIKQMAAEPLSTSPVVEGQAVNTGIRKLAVHVPSSATDKVNVVVKLIPINVGQTYQDVTYKALSAWACEDGELSTVKLLSPLGSEPITDNSVVFSTLAPKGEGVSFYLDGQSLGTPTEVDGTYTIVRDSNVVGYGSHSFRVEVGQTVREVDFDVAKPYTTTTPITYQNTGSVAYGTKTQCTGPNGVANSAWAITRGTTDSFLYYAPNYTNGTYYFETDFKADAGVGFNLEGKNGSNFIWVGELRNLIPTHIKSGAWHHLTVIQELANNGRYWIYIDGGLYTTAENQYDLSTLSTFKVQVTSLDNGTIAFNNMCYGKYNGYDYVGTARRINASQITADNAHVLHGNITNGQEPNEFIFERGAYDSFIYQQPAYNDGVFFFETDIKAEGNAHFDLEAKNNAGAFVWAGNSRNFLSYIADTSTYHHLRVLQDLSGTGNYRIYVDDKLVDLGVNDNDLSSLASFKVQVLGSQGAKLYFKNTIFGNVLSSIDDVCATDIGIGENIYLDVYKSNAQTQLPNSIDAVVGVYANDVMLGALVENSTLEIGKNSFTLNLPIDGGTSSAVTLWDASIMKPYTTVQTFTK